MSADDLAGHDRLKTLIEKNHQALLRQLRVYVLNWHLADDEEATPTTERLLSDVVVEALRVAERYDPTRSPMAWLLGIGLNIIKREIVSRRQRDRRELYVRDLCCDTQTEMSEEEIFERYLPRTGGDDFTRNLEATESWNALVAPIPEADQELLRLKYYEGLKDKMIAAILNITPQAVRQRQRRARQRLRQAHNAEQEVDRS